MMLAARQKTMQVSNKESIKKIIKYHSDSVKEATLHTLLTVHDA